MNKHIYVLLFLAMLGSNQSQSFVRSELSTTLTTPWEMTYGPDGYLWITEAGGKVSRVDPNSGAKKIVYAAPDYCAGFASEQCTACHQPSIGVGTLGLALHPNFLNISTPFIYFVYSYNSGNTTTPATKFKIVKLTWDATNDSVTSANDIAGQLPTGWDHLGGRLLAVSQNGNNYLYFTAGDNGVSETNSPTCYNPQSLNPNNYCQDTSYKNGKIHRFNIDGSIPVDNPIQGKSVFTRGHRNPQGLIFHPGLKIVYSIEHGDRTDDEINVLESGKNYGWKNIRGYHADNNYPGEAASIASFTANPGIVGDGLKEPLYSWCATPQPTTSANADWCTVAPSDGVYYNANGTGIPGWDNSLLVVTLKKGTSTAQEMYRFQLNPDGVTLAPSTSTTPNPERLFGADQTLNGRLRDIAVSPTGDKIYLINNYGADRDKITVYTYSNSAIGIKENEARELKLEIYPNPAHDKIQITSNKKIVQVKVSDLLGQSVKEELNNPGELNTSGLSRGLYLIKVTAEDGTHISRRLVKE
ncbi:MAG: PQQ-dependent sugar dehydrogenase [Bacteroidetes bacterium]|nr:PQQ-dependent sugar dehydrogenase [Bacteroidota bacterium]